MRDETHCDHGMYVGYPGGPDYMCQWCEDGISVLGMRMICKEREDNRVRAEAFILNDIYDALRDCDATDADKAASWQTVLANYRY